MHTPKLITNPLQAGIVDFLTLRYPTLALDQKDIPKRYTRYGSLLLLGPTFPTHSTAWGEIFDSLAEADKADLFRNITKRFKDDSLTHIAFNAPIAASNPGAVQHKDNVIRSPTGLMPVHGDFGPGKDECDSQYPTQDDLDAAYWTQTVQLSNIIQIWAPRWTMFSRGNVSEKARILQDSLSRSPFPGLSRKELGQPVESVDVVDFYIGIGYFAFCYLKRGVARVWGWEINGWSVEALRRGCVENGWNARVVRIDDNGNTGTGVIEQLVSDIKLYAGTPKAVRCIVFWGDNKWAYKTLREIQSCMGPNNQGTQLNVRHCNLGLLPTSQSSWDGAVQILDPKMGGWLHIHENVDVASTLAKQQVIVENIRDIACRSGKASFEVVCPHVEQVKTYAPGVVHCVYDINIYPS